MFSAEILFLLHESTSSMDLPIKNEFNEHAYYYYYFFFQKETYRHASHFRIRSFPTITSFFYKP